MSELIYPTPEELRGPDLTTPVDVTDRKINEVTFHHSMMTTEFRNKRILDLGSGFSHLGSDLSDLNIDAEVINIDMQLYALQEAAETASSGVISAQATLDRLPIADKSVDLAIATFSVPYWASSPEQINKFFNECKRVLKIGGMLSVYPITIAMLGPYRLSNFTWDSMNNYLDMEVYDTEHSPDWQIVRSRKPKLLRAIKLGHTALHIN